MNFKEAFESLKTGKRVARKAWGKNESLKYEYFSIDLSKKFGVAEKPESIDPSDFLMAVKVENGKHVPWQTLPIDVFAEDWLILSD